jgi:hypothetical protein
MTLGSQEFLRRFLLHVLPRGFVRIRSFGFLANRRRATPLPLCQRLLADQPMPHPSAATTSSPTPPTCFRCPKCSTPMVIVERLSVLTAWQLTTRSALLDSSYPTMLLSTVRASAPTAVVSLLTAVRFHPALTPLNHPHFIVALRLSKLLPTRLANPSNPSNPPLRRTNHESPMQNA